MATVHAIASLDIARPFLLPLQEMGKGKLALGARFASPA
jgi:hypothetical protein